MFFESRFSGFRISGKRREALPARWKVPLPDMIPCISPAEKAGMRRFDQRNRLTKVSPQQRLKRLTFFEKASLKDLSGIRIFFELRADPVCFQWLRAVYQIRLVSLLWVRFLHSTSY